MLCRHFTNPIDDFCAVVSTFDPLPEVIGHKTWGKTCEARREARRNRRKLTTNVSGPRENSKSPFKAGSNNFILDVGITALDGNALKILSLYGKERLTWPRWWNRQYNNRIRRMKFAIESCQEKTNYLRICEKHNIYFSSQLLHYILLALCLEP